MNIRAVFHLISYTLMFISAFLGGCWLVSLYFDDPEGNQLELVCYSAEPISNPNHS